MSPNKRVIVGDDQIGLVGSRIHDEFMFDYTVSHGGICAEFDFTPDPKEFVRMAREGKYDALMVDLNWSEHPNGHETTGYEVLAAVKEYAAIRIFHTSEEKEAREKGYEFGATHCIPKGPPPAELEKIIFGKN